MSDDEAANDGMRDKRPRDERGGDDSDSEVPGSSDLSVSVPSSEVDAENLDSSASNLNLARARPPKKKKAATGPSADRVAGPVATVAFPASAPLGSVPAAASGVLALGSVSAAAMVLAPSTPGSVIERQWQMSDFEARLTVYDWSMWRERLRSFKALPKIDVVHDANNPALPARLNEVRFLADELYCILGTGGTTIPENRPPAIIARMQKDRTDRGLPPDHRFQTDPMAIAYCIFFNTLKPVALTPYGVEEAYNAVLADVLSLKTLHVDYGLNKDSPAANDSMSKVYSSVQAVINAYRMLQHATSLSLAIDPSKRNIEPCTRVLNYVESHVEYHARLAKASARAKFLTHLMTNGAQMGYRRYRDGVYAELYTKEGYPTSFWYRVSSIFEFINRVADRIMNSGEWEEAIEKNNIKYAEDYLTNHWDSEFPFVKIDRHVFSFRNGIYFAATRTFRAYKDGVMNWGPDCKVQTHGRRQGSAALPEAVRQQFTNASANYFDYDFVEYRNISWWDIPTPTLSKIFNDQEIPEAAQRTCFGMIGRMLYDVGEMDNWQVILWILGRAGSGKSTVCRLTELFYQPDDVANISNNIEEQFGLDSVFDKLIFTASEVKRDFKLSQAEFQQMVSGERMSVARKFKKAACQDFKVPGIMAGNEMPAWIDNSNSVARRVVLVNFLKGIKKMDNAMDGKLEKEVAAIICKCNQAYHAMVQEFGQDSCWDHLPQYFRDTQNRLKARTHPVYSYLASEEVRYGADVYVPLDVFRTDMQTYCKKIQMRCNVPWNEELYAVAFQDSGLTIENVQEIAWPIGSTDMAKNATIVRGVTPREGRSFQNVNAYGGGGSAGHNTGHFRGGGPSPMKPAEGHQNVAGLTTYKAIPTLKF